MNYKKYLNFKRFIPLLSATSNIIAAIITAIAVIITTIITSQCSCSGLKEQIENEKKRCETLERQIIQNNQKKLNRGIISVGNNVEQLENYIVNISPSQREYAYSLALIKSLTSFITLRGSIGRGTSTLYTNGEESYGEHSFIKAETFNDRIRVKVITNEKQFIKNKYSEESEEEIIEIEFLKSVPNSKMPRKLALSMITSRKGNQFNSGENPPNLNTFSPLELLIELNLAGFYIVKIEEIKYNRLLLHVFNKNNNSEKIMEVNL